MRINGHALTDGERGIYATAADRARRKYLKDNGSAAVPVPDGDRVPASEVPSTDRVSSGSVYGWRSDAARVAHVATVREHGAAWESAHRAAYDAAADRAGTAAVKRHLTRHAESGHAPSAARLAELGLTGRPRRARTAAVAPETAAVAPAPADVPNAPETAPDRWTPPAAVAAAETAPRVRKTSRLRPCDRHAPQWDAVGGRRKFENACEGGNGDSECAGGVCVLIPGTDHYTAQLAAAGPVELAVLNGGASQLPPHLTITATGTVAPRPGIEPLAADRAPEPVTVPDIARASDGRVIVAHVTAAPETVPDVAAMPMTRAARKQSNRDLADALRAVDLEPRGDVWKLATVGGCSPAELAAMSADDIARAAAQLATGGEL